MKAGFYGSRSVAIKNLHKPSESSARQLRKEAHLLHTMRSEWVIGFRGMNDHCLVMEKAQGGTLLSRLKNYDIPITYEQQLRWAMQISDVLSYLHQAGFLYRDLKSCNILLDSRYNIKLADFGSCIAISGIDEKTSQAGTVAYCPLDLLLENKQNTTTDVYSLGVVLWEIITRHTPYGQYHADKIPILKKLSEGLALPEDCPEVFRAMITACLDIDPTKRPSAEAVGNIFANELKKLEKQPKFSELPQLLLSRQKSVPANKEAAPLKLTRSHSVH